MVENHIKNGKKDQCITVIDNLASYSINDLPYKRKGTLLGFNTIIKAIKKNYRKTPSYVDIINKLREKIVKFLDEREKDADVIFYVAICLYNIIISFNSYTLDNLDKFLEALLIIVTRTEPKIVAISEDLENALKSIIIYSFQRLKEGYDLKKSFKKIIELSLKESADKRLLISLIIFFNQIPNFQLYNILHLFLKDLFDSLGNSEVKNIAKKCLDDFYNEISINFDNITPEIEKKLLTTIIEKINDIDKNKLEGIDNIEIKFNAIKWISLFLKKIKKKYVESKEKSNKENHDIINYYFGKFQAILNIMINIIKGKNENNEYFKKDDKNDTSFYYHFNEITSSLKSFFEINLIKKEYKEKKIEFEKIITKNLVTENEILLKQLVEFIKTFFEIFREEAFDECVKDFFKNFTFILTSEDEKIFTVGKNTLDEMFKNKVFLKKDEQINRIIAQFLNNLSKKDLDFVIKRTDEFIKLLSEKINIQTIYKSFAIELKQINDNSEFVIKIINIINNQLLDSNNAEIIKYKIDEPEIMKQRNNFFKILFETWSINSISCLLLCLIAEDFELSYELFKTFGKINLTQDDLGEYSQMIQMFESKKFTSKLITFNLYFIYIDIRLYLMEPKKNKFLIKTLYGILFILPQGKLYNSLFERIKHIEILSSIESNAQKEEKKQ